MTHTRKPGPIKLLQLRIGRLQALATSGVETGIYKKPVDQAFLTTTGLEQDQHGDPRHHGGPEKALHHFASEHYRALQNGLPEPAAGHCQPGAFGENLVTEGLTECDVCVGDVFRLGDARLQVSQPRQPCWRLNARFGIADMSRRFQETLRTGWYYRVFQEGVIHAHDSLQLEQRDNPDWPLSRVMEVLYLRPLELESLRGMASLTTLSPNLIQLAKNRLAHGKIEDWQRRLLGPAAE